LKTQLLRVERFGLRHIGDRHHHHQNFFTSHCHNLPFTCCQTACCVSFSGFSAVGSREPDSSGVFARHYSDESSRSNVTGFSRICGQIFRRPCVSPPEKLLIPVSFCQRSPHRTFLVSALFPTVSPFLPTPGSIPKRRRTFEVPLSPLV